MAYQIPRDIDARAQAQLTKLQAMIREADEDIAAGRVGPFDKEATMQAVTERVEAARAAM